jgi:hypothetical protein
MTQQFQNKIGFCALIIFLGLMSGILATIISYSGSYITAPMIPLSFIIFMIVGLKTLKADLISKLRIFIIAFGIFLIAITTFDLILILKSYDLDELLTKRDYILTRTIIIGFGLAMSLLMTWLTKKQKE